MKRSVLCGMVVVLISTLAWGALGQGELTGSWAGTGLNSYGTLGMALVSMTLTWEGEYYQMGVSVYTLSAVPVFQATGVAYAVGDVLVCLFPEEEGVRTEVLVYNVDEDKLVWAWSALSSAGAVAPADRSLAGTYSRAAASDDS
jgi:hypothetical protein